MRPLYLVAVFGTRIIGVLTALLLSHIMTPESFGEFTLISTNALLIQMICGSWLITISNRSLVSENGSINRDMLSAIATGAIMLCATVILTGSLYATILQSHALTVAATILLSCVLMLYDLNLSVKNALGREGGYATFSISRNVLVLILSVVLVLIGFGALGPVLSIVFGTLFSLVIIPEIRNLWKNATVSYRYLPLLMKNLMFGLSGGLLLGIYILVNAPTRNLFAGVLGKDVAGAWALCSDLFYGPLAVIGNAYSLSQTRLVYLAVASGDAPSVTKRVRDFLEFTLTIAIPYAIGGLLFAPDAAALLLSPAQAAIARDVSGPAAAQGALLLLLYTLGVVALARGRLLLLAMMVFTPTIAAVAFCAYGEHAEAMSRLSVLGVLAAVGLWFVFCVSTGIGRPRGRELIKLFLAGAALGGVSVAGKYLFHFPGGWIVAAAAGTGAYIGVAVKLRLAGFGAVLPTALRRHLFGPEASGAE